MHGATGIGSSGPVPVTGRPDLELTEAVARNVFWLMSCKDEYKVARLYTDGWYETELRREFEGDYRLNVQFALPLLTRPDPVTGWIQKREFGAGSLRCSGCWHACAGFAGHPIGYFRLLAANSVLSGNSCGNTRRS